MYLVVERVYTAREWSEGQVFLRKMLTRKIAAKAEKIQGTLDDHETWTYAWGRWEGTDDYPYPPKRFVAAPIETATHVFVRLEQTASKP